MNETYFRNKFELNISYLKDKGYNVYIAGYYDRFTDDNWIRRGTYNDNTCDWVVAYCKETQNDERLWSHSLTDASYLQIPQYYYIITSFKDVSEKENFKDCEFYSMYCDFIDKLPYTVISVNNVYIIPSNIQFVSEMNIDTVVHGYMVNLINLQEFTTEPYRSQYDICKEQWIKYMQERDEHNELEGQFMKDMFLSE